MTLLQIIQEFCRRTGLPVPVSVASSGDDQVLQMMGLLNEVLGVLAEYKAFTFLRGEAVFNSIEGEDQGPLATLAPGFVRLSDNLLFNRTSNEVILGPVSTQEWQASKSGMSSISFTQYRFMGGRLFLSPAVGVGSVIAFEYVTRFPVYNDPERKPYFTLDTDVCLYPDEVMILGLRYTWRREKGLRYAENFRDFQYKAVNLAANDGGNKAIHLDSCHESGTGIGVKDCSWSVS